MNTMPILRPNDGDVLYVKEDIYLHHGKVGEVVKVCDEGAVLWLWCEAMDNILFFEWWELEDEPS